MTPPVRPLDDHESALAAVTPQRQAALSAGLGEEVVHVKQFRGLYNLQQSVYRVVNEWAVDEAGDERILVSMARALLRSV